MNKEDKFIRLPISNIRQYSRQVSLGEVELELGKHYWLGRTYVRFIKVTPKGFNFLNEEKSKCIFKRPLYAKGFSGISIPSSQTKFVVNINSQCSLFKVADAV